MAEVKAQDALEQTLDEENAILREELRTLETAKISGQKISLKELDRYG